MDIIIFFFFTLVTGPRRSLSLKLSDTRVYGRHPAPLIPRERARYRTVGVQGYMYLAHKKLPPPPPDHRRALGIVLLQGPSSRQFLMSEVPL